MLSTTSFKYDASIILSIHALIGCDAISSLFGLGEVKYFIALDKLPQIQEVAEVLKMSDATSEKLAYVKERFLLALYSHEISAEKILDTLQ